VRVAEPEAAADAEEEATTFQKLTGLQLEAERVKPFKVLEVQVVRISKFHCVMVCPLEDQDPAEVWVIWTLEAPQPDPGAEVAATVGAAVAAAVGAEVGLEVGAAVAAAVGAEVGADVGAEVGLEVGAAVGAEVGAEVGLEVGAAVGAEVGAVVLEEEVPNAISVTQMDALETTFLLVMANPEIEALEDTPKLEMGMEIRLHWEAGADAGKVTIVPTWRLLVS
jgi:carbamoylphosphate synthase large subunit